MPKDNYPNKTKIMGSEAYQSKMNPENCEEIRNASFFEQLIEVTQPARPIIETKGSCNFAQTVPMVIKSISQFLLSIVLQPTIWLGNPSLSPIRHCLTRSSLTGGPIKTVFDITPATDMSILDSTEKCLSDLIDDSLNGVVAGWIDRIVIFELNIGKNARKDCS